MQDVKGHTKKCDTFNASPWVSSASMAVGYMSKIQCQVGLTQIEKVITHATKENERQKIGGLVMIGDCCEERPDDLYAAAGKLGCPAFMFLEGNLEVAARLDTKLKVIDGPFRGTTIYNWFTLSGTTGGQKKAAQISAATLRQILESSRGVAPDPTKSNPAWLDAVKINSYGDLHGLCFLINVGIAPARDGFAAKNVIKSVIAPGLPEYYKVSPASVASPDAVKATPESANARAALNNLALPSPSPSPPPVSPSGTPPWAN
jgi:hypothetical protein